MKQITKYYKKLEDQHSKYMSAIGNLEFALSGYVKFEFSVEYLHGDGFMILNVETTDVSTVGACIDHIKEHGKLTEEDHKDYSI